MSDETLRRNAPKEDTGVKHEACVAEAWRLLSEGVYTFRAIARGVNEKTGCSHTHEWVKRALIRHSKLIEETMESGAIDSRAKYLSALYQRRASAARIANNAGARDADRLAALRIMLECDEKVAAAEGVVTQRRAEEHSGRVEHAHAVTEDQKAEVLSALKELGVISPVITDDAT